MFVLINNREKKREEKRRRYTFLASPWNVLISVALLVLVGSSQTSNRLRIHSGGAESTQANRPAGLVFRGAGSGLSEVYFILFILLMIQGAGLLLAAPKLVRAKDGARPLITFTRERTAAHLGEPRSSERGPLIKSEVRLEGRLARGGSQKAGGAPLVQLRINEEERN